MTPEDEAFEDLAKRQGDWGMQGSRKHQIMRYVETVEIKGASMTDKEAMKLALFALDIVKIHYTQSRHINEAITAIKEALAQPEQEPVAWAHKEGLESIKDFDASIYAYGGFDDAVPLYAHPPQRTEQEPASKYCCHSCLKASGGLMLDRMILCSECGNKRCPKASDHTLECTGSNELNQAGSVFSAPPVQRTEQEENKHD